MYVCLYVCLSVCLSVCLYFLFLCFLAEHPRFLGRWHSLTHSLSLSSFRLCRRCSIVCRLCDRWPVVLVVLVLRGGGDAGCEREALEWKRWRSRWWWWCDRRRGCQRGAERGRGRQAAAAAAAAAASTPPAGADRGHMSGRDGAKIPVLGSSSKLGGQWR